MAKRMYRVTALVTAPYNCTVGSDALASGIMGAFEPNDGFEVHSTNVDPNYERSDTLDELADEISDAISDSMDMDWSSSDGARAVIAMLQREGYSVVKRGEDSDVAVAIGQDAFNAGYKSAAERAIAFHPTKVTDYAAHMDAAWSDYTPPDELCGKALN